MRAHALLWCFAVWGRFEQTLCRRPVGHGCCQLLSVSCLQVFHVNTEDLAITMAVDVGRGKRVWSLHMGPYGAPVALVWDMQQVRGWDVKQRHPWCQGQGLLRLISTQGRGGMQNNFTAPLLLACLCGGMRAPSTLWQLSSGAQHYLNPLSG